jgi:hypothetical protein
MISYITGQLGAGKSAFAVMKAARGLLQGKVAAANIQFEEGWEEVVLAHAPYYRMAGRRRKKEYRIEMSGRYFFSNDLDVLLNLRLYGKGEGRGIRLIDETHNSLNNRDWESNRQKVQLRKITLSRKRGWDDYIIAQHAANTDASLRRVASIEIEMFNWKQMLQMPIVHTPLLPFHLFLATGYRLKLTGTSVSRVKKPVFRETHLLGWWRKMYDTFEDYDVEEILRDREGNIVPGASTVWLPQREAARPDKGGGARRRRIA